MTPDQPSSTRGILLMLGAMGFFAGTDVFIKLSASSVSAAHTTLLLMGGGGIVFGIIARYEGHRLLDRTAFAPILLIRYVCEIIGTFGLVLAFAFVPLPVVATIMQASPLATTLGAVLLLGERVRTVQWAAILAGFGGVLLILQPGTDGFDTALVWPVISVLGFAGRDLTTRLTPAGLGSSAMATFTMVAAMPAAIGWCLIAEGQVFPAQIPWLSTLGMVLCGAMAYLLLIASIRSTALSVVSPFRYSRLVFLMALGALVFGEQPTPIVLIGAGIIIGSGLVTMRLGRR